MAFDGETIRVEELGEGLFELCFDRKKESVNKLDRLAFAELAQALDAIAATPGLKGVLITSAKDAFIVGADIFEFVDVFAAGEGAVEGFVAANAKIISRIGEIDAPSVAAINGLALGGGFETALAADYRVISSAAKIGLPEVTLGIFPGYGGTVRLPRLIGAGEAAQWIISGAPQTAETALRAGAAEAVAEPQSLREAALLRLKEAVANPAEWRARRAKLAGPLDFSAGALDAAKATAAKALPHYPAADDAIAVIEAGAGLGVNEALDVEAKGFAVTAVGQAASSLVGIFINDQAVKKSLKTYAKAAAPVRKAAVLGAGVMGAGVAYQSALKGVPVILKDVSQKALDHGKSYASKLLDKQIERGKLGRDRADDILASIMASETFDGFADVDVVVEAIIEEIKVKEKVFAEVEAKSGAHTLLCSNTSSLRIKDLAVNLQRPQNFLGMHFFNPVPAMALVEVIRGPQTTDEALATIVNYAAALGKTPIVVGDCPGFVVNRVLTPYLIAFLLLVRDGVDYRDIDRAVEAFGWPMGPAYLSDVIGLDITQHVIEIVSEGFAGRLDYPKPGAVELLKADGRLGQKNGRGFYIYSKDAKGRPAKEADPAAFDLLKPGQSGAASLSDADIVERMMIPMLLEAARCLEDGTVARPGDVDMCLLLGLGLPRYLGGALKYADWLGLGQVEARAAKWESLGPIYRPSAEFSARAAAGKRFYAG